MSAPPVISINDVAIDPSAWSSPRLAAVHELLRQRAVAIGLLGVDAAPDTVDPAIEELIDREVKVPAPTEEECRRFYDGHLDLFRSGDLVFVRHILFQVTPGSQIAIIREQAQETLQQVIASPDEFQACAVSLSNCPSGLQGGNLGQLGRGDTVPEFEEAIFGDGWIGILPRLVKTRFGFHIVSIDRRVEGHVLPFDAARAQIAERLAERVQAVALRQYVRVLAGAAKIQGIELEAAASPLVQ